VPTEQSLSESDARARAVAASHLRLVDAPGEDT
jgi:hypothetical protein